MVALILSGGGLHSKLYMLRQFRKLVIVLKNVKNTPNLIR